MCLYCKCKIWNVTRRMICKHVRESLVKEAIQLLLKSLERGNYWKQITRLSDFDENIKLMRNLEPPIFVVRKQEKEKRKKLRKIKIDLAICCMCKLFFKADLINRQKNVYSMCDKVSGDHSQPLQLKNLLRASPPILLSSELAGNTLYNFTPDILGKMMRGDYYHSCIRNDLLPLLFGTIQMQMKETGRYQGISYTLRCTGKLIIKFKRIAKQEDLIAIDVILPRNFEKIVMSMKSLSGMKSHAKLKCHTLFLNLVFILNI